MNGFRLKLYEYMEEKNLTTSSVAKKTGITRTTIHNILNGTNKNPSANTISEIIKRLGMKLESFLDEENIHENISDSRILEPQEWLLLKEIVTYSIDSITEKDIKLSKDQWYRIITKIYNYSLREEPMTVDKKFINYVIDQQKKD